MTPPPAGAPVQRAPTSVRPADAGRVPATGLPRPHGRPARSAVPARTPPEPSRPVATQRPAAAGPSGSAWRRHALRRRRRRRTSSVARARQEPPPERRDGHPGGQLPSRRATARRRRRPRFPWSSDGPAPHPVVRAHAARVGRDAPPTGPWGRRPSPSSGSTPPRPAGSGEERLRPAGDAHGSATTTRPTPNGPLPVARGRRLPCRSRRHRAVASRPSDEHRSPAPPVPEPHHRSTPTRSPGVSGRRRQEEREHRSPCAHVHVWSAVRSVGNRLGAASRSPRAPWGSASPSPPREHSPERVPARGGDAALLAAHSS